MSEYGCGVSMQQAFAYDKEKIKKAFDNLLVVGEDENGFIYKGCTDEEARDFILRAFDNAVYWALKNNATAKAQEEMINLYQETGIPKKDDIFADFLVISEEKERIEFENGEYEFERDEECIS